MSAKLLALLFSSLADTLYMVGVSSLIAFLFGLPLGVVLLVTEKGQLLESAVINRLLGSVVNAARSTPFIILMVLLIPVTRAIVGTSIGTNAAIVPLAIAATPFVGRVIEGALREVDGGVVEAALSMGASPWQIIVKVLLPEALPAIVVGLTLSVINLIGYSAMAGAIGGGGLGDLAIRYGYQRFRLDVMFLTVVVLIALVHLCQGLGDLLARRLRRDGRN
ncbi:ABC transporter permease [Aminithiophilus ramosus]|uniref:ABC transporter permease n=2 Tax=Synergistales TaxID=649776 RepID=A0A9Q7ARF6_9BACT|nr:methionine ABC transporter permease [Aminithiophilus ramosus]QTX32646.1 ABC transporter permease [Aminithiophilus ramosus]QVL36521.1 ABC transporter permease [Synergistota bacterium]